MKALLITLTVILLALMASTVALIEGLPPLTTMCITIGLAIATSGYIGLIMSTATTNQLRITGTMLICCYWIAGLTVVPSVLCVASIGTLIAAIYWLVEGYGALIDYIQSR